MFPAEATPLFAGATPLFAGASASMRLPRERIECPEVRGIRPFRCVVPGRSGRRRTATGATGVSARDCRTPASDVSESFDVVWRRRGLARKDDIAPKRLGWEQIGSGGRRSRFGRGPTKVILSSEWRVACRATLSAICADWADPALPGGNLKRTRPRGAENRAKGEAPAVRNGSYLKEW